MTIRELYGHESESAASICEAASSGHIVDGGVIIQAKRANVYFISPFRYNPTRPLSPGCP
jgi:hypothetical protein